MLSVVASFVLATAQSFQFDFPSQPYTAEQGFGYDLNTSWDGKANDPFFFSVDVPDGNYRVTVTLGSQDSAGNTTVRAESRRLFVENLETKKGELVTKTFTVNKRSPKINDKDRVKLKEREKKKLNWDDKLTLEFNGDAPRVTHVEIQRIDNVPTIFLCGNSTVVDNDNEPWASWGQMLPRFFDENVAIANHAESGLSANTFVGGKRLDKIVSQLKRGDYVFVEFGHNDQKQKGPGKGAYYEFSFYIKQFIDQARAKGATPVLVTPTRRRQFDNNGQVKDTHEDFPAAIRDIAARENVAVIELQEMTKTLIEAMGEEESKHLFVHYPAGTWPGQSTEFKDNTHFNPFGAYEVAKCVIEGMKQANLPVVKHLRDDYMAYDPANPDKFADFHWANSPFTEIEKPDGN